jgi:hypothetical protein
VTNVSVEVSPIIAVELVPLRGGSVAVDSIPALSVPVTNAS